MLPNIISAGLADMHPMKFFLLYFRLSWTSNSFPVNPYFVGLYPDESSGTAHSEHQQLHLHWRQRRSTPSSVQRHSVDGTARRAGHRLQDCRRKVQQVPSLSLPRSRWVRFEIAHYFQYFQRKRSIACGFLSPICIPLHSAKHVSTWWASYQKNILGLLKCSTVTGSLWNCSLSNPLIGISYRLITDEPH